jgi:cytidylate kinase
VSASSPTVVAIDGAAGTGKSTVARRLARELRLPYLDTGAMYRALALFVLDRGVDPDDRVAVAALLPEADLHLRLDADANAEVLLAGQSVEARIRSAEVAAATSRVAVHPEVRALMVELQRRLAREVGGVIEGRDIGTRVVPDAPHKFFLVADPTERSRRRLADLRAAGESAATLERVERELAERDARDASRALSPLTPAPDAITIDTTRIGAEAVVARLRDEIRHRGGPLPSREGAAPG